MRYSRMTDIGLTEAQIKDNLLFAGKAGRIDEDRHAQQGGQGVVRRGAAGFLGDHPLTRCRLGLYLPAHLLPRRHSEPGGTTLVFDKVGMPHVLQDMQGHLAPVYRTETGHEGKSHQVIDHLNWSSRASRPRLSTTPAWPIWSTI
jgi:ubiquinol-cytochrome c reductase cytochrome c1 subunit